MQSMNKNDLSELMEQEEFKKIILLTFRFQDAKNRGKNNTDSINGLEQIHYRYALEKNFSFPKKWVKKKRDVINFFW